MHPKTEIRPERDAIRKVLERGWVGQVKIHGHRAQIHIPAEEAIEPIAYNRQGRVHQKLLPPEIVVELRRLFAPETGWSVIDAEWLKPEGKLYVFDFIKKDGVLLSRLGYGDRYKLLPREFISPCVQILPLLTSVDKCMEVFADRREHIEGLVFKAMTSAGFSDTSIVRCRKPESRR
jgi:hypothetical protein